MRKMNQMKNVFITAVLVVVLMFGLSACMINSEKSDISKQDMKQEERREENQGEESEKMKNEPIAIKEELPRDQKDIPEEVISYAKEHVEKEIAFQNGLKDAAYRIVDAKIVGLTKIPNAVASEFIAVNIYLLEYRLLPEQPDKVLLAGGMQKDGDWLTESKSAGQPLLVMLETSGDVDKLERIAVSNTLTVDEEYNTERVIEEFGDPYTAFAAQMLEQYKLDEK